MQPAQRPTVVLLHSSASSARQWERLVEALAPHFRVRAIELHGHGERMAWRGDAPLTLADEAALAVPLLEEAGGAHVVGHSYGAAVALKLTTMYPKLVRSLVTYEPVLFRWLFDDIDHQQLGQGVVTVADSMRDRLANGQEHSAAQLFIDFWSGAGSWDSVPSGKQTSIAARMRAVFQQFDTLFREPLQRAQLALLNMPMMFVSVANCWWSPLGGSRIGLTGTVRVSTDSMAVPASPWRNTFPRGAVTTSSGRQEPASSRASGGASR